MRFPVDIDFDGTYYGFMRRRGSKKNINRDFIHVWTPELAWWLGLMYGDGCVHRSYKTNRLLFGCSDRTTTEKWRALICPDSGTQEGENDFLLAYVDDKALVEWFASRGVVGEKAATLEWPEYLPREYCVEFLRGLWDTDGSVTIEDRKKQRERSGVKCGNDTLIASFTASNRSFVSRVLEEIIGACGVGRVAVCKNIKVKDGKVYIWHSFKYSGAQARIICDVLYGNSPEALRGNDRYIHYDNYLKILETRVCACGKPSWSDEFCQNCFWKNWRKENPRETCGCGKPVDARGMCLTCYKRDRRRRKPGIDHKPNGTCECGADAFRRGFCDRCYAREYRKLKKGLDSKLGGSTISHD